MKIHFMRHGQTNYNVLGLCNDDPAEDVHLTALGIRQAEAAAEALKHAALEQVFVSELPRTRQTADIVNRYHRAPVAVHAALNDLRSGFNNRPVAEYFAAAGNDRLRFRAEGGESLLDYKARVQVFLDWLVRQPWQRVLVVAHEETLRVAAAHARGLDDRTMEALHFANAEILTAEL